MITANEISCSGNEDRERGLTGPVPESQVDHSHYLWHKSVQLRHL
jgi:hypothetical protein